MALVPSGGNSARLELPGGPSQTLTLPDRTLVSTLAALDGGWLAAGSAPNARGGRNLVLLRGNDKQSQPLAEPPGQKGFIRFGPVFLVDQGRLAGLAWLEGDDLESLSVRSAAWTGKGWGPVQQVSYPGPGAQIALAGAVLEDGSWLLAWSASDGKTAEIVWSRRVGETWQPVSRLSKPNAVPDITPALTALSGGAGGALIAWSRYDYDGKGYELRMARFDRAKGEWRDEHAAAPAGSVFPAFVGGPDTVRLLYRNAVPRAWSVFDLDRQGRIVAKATVPSALARPVLSFAGGEVRMRWPSEKRSAAARLEKVP